MTKSIVHLRCTKCDKDKHDEDFSRDRSGRSSKRRGRTAWCKQCFREYRLKKREDDPRYWADRSATWRNNNPEQSKKLNGESARRQYERAKRVVVEAYGGKCTCCGENEIHFLTVEHKTPEALDRHRYPNGRRRTAWQLLRLIAKEGFPDDITILCFNCNMARGFYGFCPHQEHSVEQRRYVDV